MLIQLTDCDLAKMPTVLCEDFLGWLQSMNSDSFTQTRSQPQNSELETLRVGELNQSVREESGGYIGSNTSRQEGRDRTHVLLSQLLDAGITRPGMHVRVRLKRERAREVGRDYLNSLIISSKGTVLYDGEEFDKPSPLAGKLNGSPVNGWEYIEIKKDDMWIRLDALREQVR